MMTKNTKTLGGLLLVVLLCINCKDTENPIVEPMNSGDYYITNNTSAVLIISAIGLFGTGEATLLTNEIDPGDKTQIFTFTEGSGGHVMPSNAWEEFSIYSGIKSENTLVYSGIADDDWKEESLSSEGRLVYNLTIE